MNLGMIAWRNLQQRALASSLTGLSMALGVMLVCAVLVVHGITREYLQRNMFLGYNVIVGAKGGREQLVLNTSYHMFKPVENIPYSFYKKFLSDPKTGWHGEYADLVEFAIPYCLGDNYQGFRVVGTTTKMFDDYFYQRNGDGTGLKYEFAAGRNFKAENFYEAVIGARVARETGLKVGDTFQPAHGITEDKEDSHVHDPFTVVGVLKPSGTPNDRALFVNIEGFYLLDGHAKEAPPGEEEELPLPPGAMELESAPAEAESSDAPAHAPGVASNEDAGLPSNAGMPNETGRPGGALPVSSASAAPSGTEPTATKPGEHDHATHKADAHGHEGHGHDAHGHEGHDHHHGPLPESQREVTAILVQTAADSFAGITLANMINEGNAAQAVFPVEVITRVMTFFVEPLQYLLLSLTVLIVVVSGISILVSIYNSMNERRREIAILRALGASRRTVMAIVLCEALWLSLGGGLLGWAVGHLMLGVCSPLILFYTGIEVGAFQFVPNETYLIPGLMILATLVGLLPSLTAYRTQVTDHLNA